MSFYSPFNAILDFISTNKAVKSCFPTAVDFLPFISKMACLITSNLYCSRFNQADTCMTKLAGRTLAATFVWILDYWRKTG